MKVELDLERDILHIKIGDAAAKGLIKMSEDLYFEVDEGGGIVGIQLRNAKRHIVEGVAHRIKKLVEESDAIDEDKER
ncbi:MAG: hypothetical protein QXD66_01295 [Candidatus Nezhaarchaeales archaeon]|nr:MAG: hypothetical protein DSO06_01065 [Candidatus Nezhaarchaeota archaeon WYZ-LMO8]TDA37355.1 MAG: hypothetical protein DSO05_00110 [Candidatus Nezhaarchaeota archaeon WYZ-LMO7]